MTLYEAESHESLRRQSHQPLRSHDAQRRPKFTTPYEVMNAYEEKKFFPPPAAEITSHYEGVFSILSQKIFFGIPKFFKNSVEKIFYFFECKLFFTYWIGRRQHFQNPHRIGPAVYIHLESMHHWSR